jgi:hypothetical protein
MSCLSRMHKMSIDRDATTWKIQGAGLNITVGHRPLAEQNADMAVYWLLCTDIMADRFVSLIWKFLSLLLQIFLTNL